MKSNKKKYHRIDWGVVWTTVITGCILGALGVLGTMVYQGAILKTQTNEATSLIIIDSVAENTVAIHELVSIIESVHYGEVDVSAVEHADIIQPPKKVSPFNRLVDAVTFKPLWEKSSAGEEPSDLYGAVYEDDPVIPIQVKPDTPVLEQQDVVDNIKLKIVEKTNEAK